MPKAPHNNGAPPPNEQLVTKRQAENVHRQTLALVFTSLEPAEDSEVVRGRATRRV